MSTEPHAWRDRTREDNGGPSVHAMDQRNEAEIPRRILVGWNGSEASRDALNLAVDLAAGLEARLLVGSIPDEDPVAGLRELALKESADLLVLGATHRGAPGRLIPGSVTERLLMNAPCAVAVAPHNYARTEPHLGFGLVGVGYDGSPASRAALAFANDLAEKSGARSGS